MRLYVLVFILISICFQAIALVTILEPYSGIDYSEIKAYDLLNAQETEETCDCYPY